MQEAKAKLQAEMDAAKDNDYVQFIGQFLQSHIDSHPEDAPKFMDEGKSIAKSLDAMRSAAEKKKKGNVAMLTPNEGFAIVLEYYGIKGAVPAAPAAPAPVEQTAAPTKPGSDFDFKLDDYGL